MPRLKKTIRPVKQTLHIPEDVINRAELRLLDPLTGQVRYGAKSKLVTRLLREWLSEEEPTDA